MWKYVGVGVAFLIINIYGPCLIVKYEKSLSEFFTNENVVRIILCGLISQILQNFVVYLLNDNAVGDIQKDNLENLEDGCKNIEKRTENVSPQNVCSLYYDVPVDKISPQSTHLTTNNADDFYQHSPRFDEYEDMLTDITDNAEYNNISQVYNDLYNYITYSVKNEGSDLQLPDNAEYLNISNSHDLKCYFNRNLNVNSYDDDKLDFLCCSTLERIDEETESELEKYNETNYVGYDRKQSTPDENGLLNFKENKDIISVKNFATIYDGYLYHDTMLSVPDSNLGLVNEDEKVELPRLESVFKNENFDETSRESSLSDSDISNIYNFDYQSSINQPDELTLPEMYKSDLNLRRCYSSTMLLHDDRRNNLE